ncbi:unnamed protein product [Tuwongella immobilis]|uniref:Uncharacterized protein n=1 Tax=Tuwongella immobilis TaxID=692036 RepID=A0A6C2YP03_9BACT|nr:unnamed protein product [Tuwongella immobilis]VTS03378.1 unnamed protein product [Tuwongella immobilis]
MRQEQVLLLSGTNTMRLLTIREISKRICVPTRLIREWVQSGTFPSPTILPGDLERWDFAEVQTWMLSLRRGKEPNHRHRSSELSQSNSDISQNAPELSQSNSELSQNDTELSQTIREPDRPTGTAIDPRPTSLLSPSTQVLSELALEILQGLGDAGDWIVSGELAMSISDDADSTSGSWIRATKQLRLLGLIESNFRQGLRITADGQNYLNRWCNTG